MFRSPAAIAQSKEKKPFKKSPAHTKYKKTSKIFKTHPVQILVHEVLSIQTVLQKMKMSQPSLELQH